MSIPAFRIGQEVTWTPDGDEGTVLRVLPGEAVCIRWASDGRQDCWYPAGSGSLEKIEIVGLHDEEREAA